MTDITDKKEDSDKNMMDCSEEEESAEQEVPVNAKICILGNLVDDDSVLEAAKSFKVPVETSRDGSELFNSPINSTVFVVEEFSGPLFEKLKEMKHRILGPTALKELSQEHVKFPDNKRPMYSTAMKGVFVSFTGFRYKEELSRLMLMIHNMGGSVRQDILSKVTHVIANRCGGKKYQYAATFKIPIMSPEWVHNSWAMRTQVGFKSSVDGLAEHKLKAFHGARVCFLGFPEEERLHMADILLENGGISTDIQDPKCTHVIIDESTTTTVPPQVPPKAYIVKAEWFWASVQKERCVDENDHVFQEYVGRLTPVISVNSTPVSSIRARKRKRLRTYRLNSGSPGITSPKLEPLKRRSSITDATLLSCSGSFLDASPSTDLEDVESGSETPRKNLSARHQVFLELLQTESNYVGILNTIVSLFKAPLDEMVDGEDQLLNATESKIIFGNLPPIQHAHANMLEDLKHIAHNWTEEVSIGNVIQKYFADLVKAYPPFVNFFENTREMLRKCDQSKPRFHAFLKARQTRAECGRQSLMELLIRPVQRLPSISLLLNDILKHTTKNNPDYTALETALNSIREVMTHINEDKRKTEGQMVMFDIFNDIDNCPPDLVSSHRSFIFRCDVIELSDSHFSLSRRGDPLVFYVFSDVVEICKKRSKTFNSLKSPNGNLGKISNAKPYKHIKLIPLSQIRKVVDIKETEDCHKVFALMCFSTQDLKEKIYSFAITEDGVDKMSFLKTLCRQTANNACVTDAETFMASLGPDALQIDTSDVSLGTLGKAFKFASRTRLKVGRALSFNKTPSKLKRAMSTMMSPFGSTTNLTPATQLAQMRLASCTNINELANSPPPPQLVAPLSVQPTRRAKHSSLGVSSLRRL